MSRVAYIGACPAEAYCKFILAEDEIVFKSFRVNKASFMDISPIDINLNFHMSAELKKRISYESKKDFPQKLEQSKPEVIVVDFTPEVRMPLIEINRMLMSFPYEMVDNQNFLEQFRAHNECAIIDFDSDIYWQRLSEAIYHFSNFINSLNARSIILVIPRLINSIRPLSSKRQEVLVYDHINWAFRQVYLDVIHHEFINIVDNLQIFDPHGDLFTDDNAHQGAGPHHFSAEVWARLKEKFSDFHYSKEEFQNKSRKIENLSKIGSLGLVKSFINNHNLFTHQHPDPLLPILPYLFNMFQIRENFLDKRPSVVDILDAYTWILGRPPEAINAVHAHLLHSTQSELRTALLLSGEFKSNFTRMDASVDVEKS